MSTIETLLHNIEVAKHGEDVRGSIHDAIEQCYSDVHNPTLNTEAIEAAVQTKIDEGEMAALTIGDGTITTAKIANGAITQAKLDPNISFEADAVLDETSTNAIQNKAVASAISELNGSLGVYKNYEVVKDTVTLDSVTYALNGNAFTVDDVTKGYYLDIETGAPVAKTGETYSKLICCVGGADIIVARHVRVCFYDKGQNFISGYQGTGSANYEGSIPSNAEFIRVTSKGLGNNTNLFQNAYQKVLVSAYVPEWHYIIHNVGIEWDDVISRDAVNENLSAAQKLGYSFDIYDMIIPANTVVQFRVGEYCKIPFALGATPQYKVFYYNANMEIIHSNETSTGNYDYEYLSPRNILKFDSLRAATIETYTSLDDLSIRLAHGREARTFNEDIAYIKFDTLVSLDEIYTATPAVLDRKHISVNEDHSEGLLEQTLEYSLNDMVSNFPSLGSEFVRRVHAEMIWTVNDMRHAIRLCTFNRSRAGKANWYKIKEVMQMYAPNICGLQELSSPYEGTPQFDDFFESWHFKHFSDNGTIYPANERMLMTTEKFPIDSSVETFLSTGTNGDRYVVKSVLSMPRYMDKRGTELMKMSVYNFQLEFSSIENAQAILNMVTQDENPFIVCMGDTNDFTNDKTIYGMFREAGLTPILGLDTATTSGEGAYECIDNIFVNHRFKPLQYDVINANRFPFISNGVTSNLSDHNLVFADVELDYSDIHTITYTLTNVTISISTGRTWFSDDETVTITVTPDTGYYLAWNTGNFMLRDAGAKVKNDVFVGDTTGGTITLVGSQMRGDFHIYAKGIANS